MIGPRRMALVAANLGLAFAGYLVWAGDDPTGREGGVASLAGRPAKAPASAAEDMPAPDAKPLFRIRPPAPIAEPEEPAVSPAAPNFRLAGVVWSETEKVAIVQMNDDGRHRRVRPGEAVDGWTLSGLSQRTALVEAGAEKVLMKLSADTP